MDAAVFVRRFTVPVFVRGAPCSFNSHGGRRPRGHFFSHFSTIQKGQLNVDLGVFRNLGRWVCGT